MRIAHISTYDPRECGIATFCKSLLDNLPDADSRHEHMVIALNDPGQHYNYPDEVKFVIRENILDDYHKAADFINQNADIVILQHEFNIYGGNEGVFVLPLMNKLKIPAIAIFHTVFKKPSVTQKLILQEISRLAENVVVISETAASFCESIYQIPHDKLRVFRHGIPEIDINNEEAREQLNLQGKKVIITFGLLTRNKGFETILRALPKIVKKHPDVIYLCLGKTHPVVKKETGEEYREHLESLVDKFDIHDFVIFKNKFLTDYELEKYLSATDFLVTPYLHEEQISSGPLTFAMASHTAILSTPYWYAQELLDEGRGEIFQFKNHRQLAEILIDLIDNQDRLDTLKSNAYQFGKQIIWPKISKAYISLAEEILQNQKSKAVLKNSGKFKIPEISIQHIQCLSDENGIFTHAKYGLPDRLSGYSLSDNALALLAGAMLYQTQKSREAEKMIYTHLSFIQSMQKEDGCFRNHMNYDHSFSGSDCSEDAFGRTIWALGYLVSRSPRYMYLEAAKGIFEKAAIQFKNLSSLRGMAGTIIGIHYFLEIHSSDQQLTEIMYELTSILTDKLKQEKTSSWSWFEDKISGGYAILPLALLYSSMHVQEDAIRMAALDTIKFLTKNCFHDGHLSLFGSDGWYLRGETRARYAQLPNDAMLMVLLYNKAWELTGNRKFYDQTGLCFSWFMGNNDLCISMYDPESKGCCDELEEYGLNRNQGAESSLSFLMANITLQSIREQNNAEDIVNYRNDAKLSEMNSPK